MYNKKLIIFDFDFTIAKTIEHIWVWSPRGNLISNNKTYRKAHPTELQQHGISDDENIDDNSFTEFYDLNINKTELIKPIIPYLKFYSQEEIFILTARPQIVEDTILTFLQNNQINTKYIQLIGLTSSCMSKKITWIDQTIKKFNYNQLILFEDNKKLIDHYLIKCNYIMKHLYYIQNYPQKTVITFYE
jgi:hypothetical protein